MQHMLGLDGWEFRIADMVPVAVALAWALPMGPGPISSILCTNVGF